jgi:4-amino-4-deoxy-L-arabinose transferase-like glycosyltransferase
MMSLRRNILSNDYRFLFLVLLAGWFLLNLIQAVYTEVISDEAYYWIYGRNLDWGFFDHPPMVGLMTHISSLFFRGNLGLRMATVVLQPVTVFLIWRIIDDKKPDRNKVLFFFMIASSVCLFSAYGFYTTPDSPLLFFSALFLWSYKIFLHKANWKAVGYLAVAMAGLVYSKYQGILVIVFIILADLRLLWSGRFWIASVVAVSLYAPHIWWQIIHHYPTIKYHLIDRPEGFRVHHLAEFLPNQLIALNPVILGTAIYIIVKQKIEDKFIRGLCFEIVGFIGFFWMASFRDHVEPQWTIAAAIPMIIIIYERSVASDKMRSFLIKCLVPFIILIFAARVLLVTDLPFVKNLGFAGREERYKFIGSVAGDLPVVFPGSYQKPSLYTFFTGHEGFGLSLLVGRKTQFDIMHAESRLHDKPAFIYNYAGDGSVLYQKGNIKFKGYFTDSLQTVNGIIIRSERFKRRVGQGDNLTLQLSLKNPYMFDIDFHHRQFPVSFQAAFVRGKQVLLYPVEPDQAVDKLPAGGLIYRQFIVMVPDIPPGDYVFGISLKTSVGPTFNDSFNTLAIKER